MRPPAIEAPDAKIQIDSVEFQGTPHLSTQALEQLVISLKSRQLGARPDWISDEETVVRNAWQEQGYFRALVEVVPHLLRAELDRQYFVLTIRVEDGPQYRMAGIRFRENGALPSDQLRRLMPLQEGDLFNVAKIRDGIEAIRRLYVSLGFIDATFEPDLEINEQSSTILLSLTLDEQKRYSIGTVEVLGPDPITKERIKAEFPLGQIFNGLVDRIFKKYRSVLPPDASPENDVEVLRDSKNGLVTLRFDFRTCLQSPN